MLAMSVSLWERSGTARRERCAALVLGGGVVGLSVLHALQKRAIDAMLLDRGGVGTGASSRNAGYLMRGAADNYAAAVRDWGRDVARARSRMYTTPVASMLSCPVALLYTTVYVPCAMAFS